MLSSFAQVPELPSIERLEGKALERLLYEENQVLKGKSCERRAYVTMKLGNSEDKKPKWYRLGTGLGTEVESSQVRALEDSRVPGVLEKMRFYAESLVVDLSMRVIITGII